MASLPILEHALAVADLGLRVFPLRPLDKRPLHEDWQDEASTDPTVISQWFAANPRINYGVRTGLANNLLVIDLDGTPAQKWWKSTGIESGAKVTTPSGADRTHLYYSIDDVEVFNTQGTIHEHVDSRGEGGYVVGPGSMLPSGSYYGDLRHIPDAPDALLALMPEKQVYSTEVFVGEQVTAASSVEEARVDYIIRRLTELPRVWREGAGWRSTMFAMGCWLSRMTNSPAYAMTENAALTILLTYTPTNSEWGDVQILEQWASAVKSTAGQQAEPPKIALPHLLPFMDVANLLPPETSTGLNFLDDLVFAATEPADDTQARRTILAECFRAGLNTQQAVTIAWNSKPATLLQREMSGLAQMWAEADEVETMVDVEQGDTPLPVPVPTTSLKPERLSLLSDDERAFVAEQAWWGTRYLDYAESKVALMNAPYHRMNRWVALSLVFADAGFIPDPVSPIFLNLYTLILGKTTTGKTEALKILKAVVTACFPKGDSPYIGGNASPNALLEKLIQRDGKPSWFQSDEAHGLLKQMSGDGQWMSGLKELLTALYEGEVPMILRSGAKDVSGIDAKTFFTMHLQGTIEGLVKVIDTEMWESGFLARYIWAVGADLEPKEDTYDARQVIGTVEATYDVMPRQWASEFAAARAKLKRAGPLPLAILHDADALDRQTEVQRKLASIAKGHRYSEMLRPTFVRLGINIRKCAVLCAMSEGSPTVSMKHELIAIEAAEEWIENIMVMVGQTTASGFSRAVDEVENYLAKQKNGEARPDQIIRFFGIDKQITQRYLDQLKAEERIYEHRVLNKEGYTYKIKGARA